MKTLLMLVAVLSISQAHGSKNAPKFDSAASQEQNKRIVNAYLRTNVDPQQNGGSEYACPHSGSGGAAKYQVNDTTKKRSGGSSSI